MKKYLVVLIAAFLLGGCASSKNAVIPVTAHSGPPVSAEKRAALEQAVQNYRQFQAGAQTEKFRAPAPVMEPESRPEPPAAPRTQPLPTPPHMTGRPAQPAPPPPLPYRGNPGHGDFATKEDLNALSGKVDQIGRNMNSLAGVVLEHDGKLADLWLNESRKSGGLLPIRIGFPSGQSGDSARIRAQAAEAANIINSIAARGGQVMISVVGYASHTGSEARNLRLSEERAQTVARLLSPLLQGAQMAEVTGVGQSRAGQFTSSNECVRIFFN